MSYNNGEYSWADYAAEWLDGKYTVGGPQDFRFSVSSAYALEELVRRAAV